MNRTVRFCSGEYLNHLRSGGIENRTYRYRLHTDHVADRLAKAMAGQQKPIESYQLGKLIRWYNDVFAEAGNWGRTSRRLSGFWSAIRSPVQTPDH